jgi:RNA polymerase sigma-70 factor (ECF subfamily)
MELSKQDQELVERIRARDEKSIVIVYELYHKQLYSFVFRQLRVHDITEEIVQDVFFEFIESLRNFRGQSSLKTFLFSIAKYKTIDVIRRKKIKKILFSALPDYVVEGLKTILLDDEVDRHELQERISAVIGNLPHDYQVALRLKYLEGRRVKEIATMLKLSFKAAESLIFRARQAFVAAYNKNNNA